MQWQLHLTLELPWTLTLCYCGAAAQGVLACTPKHCLCTVHLYSYIWSGSESEMGLSMSAAADVTLEAVTAGWCHHPCQRHSPAQLGSGQEVSGNATLSYHQPMTQFKRSTMNNCHTRLD